MKLLSLFLKGRKNIGLESDELIFGKEVTELYGPNGSGKTPLIQSIIFCLGYPCKFRDEIYRSCQYARLKFEIDDKIYISEREFSNEFILNLYFDGVVNRFYNELDYSKFIFDLLNINSPSLITTQKKQTYPYLSSILPIYYLDQDSGFSRYYNAPANYIKDQFSEMLRLIFQLPEKIHLKRKNFL
ncbi:AAA family ATPase [Providencia rettgeri]